MHYAFLLLQKKTVNIGIFRETVEFLGDQIFVKIKFYGIYEFMIYCIYKCSKELLKAFY